MSERSPVGRTLRPLGLAGRIASALAIFLAMLEVGAASAHYLRLGELTWIRSADPEALEPENSEEAARKFSPLFGFSYRPGCTVREALGERATSSYLRLLSGQDEPAWLNLTANRFGFFAGEFPIDAKESDFVVGVLGGSVAQWFSLNASVPLAGALGVAPENLKIVNLSQGAFKQPQQVMALTLALALEQRLDALINIDGFNEVALATENRRAGIHPVLPAARSLGEIELLTGKTSSPAKAELAAKELLRYQRRARFQYKSEHTRFALLSLLLKAALSRGEDARFAGVSERTGASESFGSGTISTASSLGMVSIWSSSSITLQGISSGREIPYLHVLQPNQYFSSKSFGRVEAGIALRLNSPFAETVGKLYPLLKVAGHRLSEEGIAFLDATELFDHEKRATYSDSCCHYTSLGNEILAKAIGQRLVGLL